MTITAIQCIIDKFSFSDACFDIMESSLVNINWSYSIYPTERSPMLNMLNNNLKKMDIPS